MKYQYGNSVKEALSNPPVDIETVEQLKGYEDNYNVVIPYRPDTVELTDENISHYVPYYPDKVELTNEDVYGGIDDDWLLTDCIDIWFEENFGTAPNYDWYKKDGKVIVINIKWEE